MLPGSWLPARAWFLSPRRSRSKRSSAHQVLCCSTCLALGAVHNTAPMASLAASADCQLLPSAANMPAACSPATTVHLDSPCSCGAASQCHFLPDQRLSTPAQMLPPPQLVAHIEHKLRVVQHTAAGKVCASPDQLPQASASGRPAMPPNMAEQMRGMADQMRSDPAMAEQMRSMMQGLDPEQFKTMVCPAWPRTCRSCLFLCSGGNLWQLIPSVGASVGCAYPCLAAAQLRCPLCMLWRWVWP